MDLEKQTTRYFRNLAIAGFAFLVASSIGIMILAFWAVKLLLKSVS